MLSENQGTHTKLLSSVTGFVMKSKIPDSLELWKQVLFVMTPLLYVQSTATYFSCLEYSTVCS